MKKVTMCALLCFSNCGLSKIAPTPIIQIAQGKLRGVAMSSQNKYLGIPYATVVKRFQAPGDPPIFDDLFEANKNGKSCIQLLPKLGIPVGKENCLNLNVYTPKNMNPDEPIPVMVFIHGGGFAWGASSSHLYEPSALVANGVVVVTINYRLSALGFLCLGIEEAPGNAGLKDQVAALRWVKENIKAFGGDPDSVTIFGESAGAASVHYLVLSRMAKGLFHRAIMESASSLDPWAFSYDPIVRALTIAKNLGYNGINPQELYAIFQNTSAKDIVMAANTDDVMEQYVFTPCAENKFPGTEPFLTKSPKNVLLSGIFNRVPMIMGYNDKEGIIYAGMKTDKQLAEYDVDFDQLLPRNLVFPSKYEKKNVADRVKKFYFNNRSINKNTIRGLIDFFSDTFFHSSIVRSSEMHLKTSQQPLYNYYFKYDSARNMGKLTSGLLNQPGASHTDELFYIFQPTFWVLPLIERDRTMMDRMTLLWTNFAKTSNPTPSPSALIPQPWTRSNSTELDFMTLDKDLSMRSLPNPERIKLWKDIYNKYYIKY